MTPLDPRATRRILIRANNWIGDVVMISPAVRAIRERFTEARIAIVAKRWVLEALAGNPYYDDLLEYDPAGRHAGPLGRLRLAREIRRGGRVDLAILFQKAFDAAVIALLAGARVRVGYPTDARRLLLTHAVPLPPRGMHHAETFLNLARAIGCPVGDRRPFFHLDEAARVQARRFVETSLPVGAGPVVALHPGASKGPRAWHAARFGELAHRLRRRLDARVIVLTGPGEEGILDEVIRGLQPGWFAVCGAERGLRHSAAVLDQCDLFVGNDSGPMHVAAALGIPTLGIFGPGHPRNTGPLGSAGRVAVLGRDYPCAPCRQAFFTECPPAPSGKPFCLEEIAVDEVERTALALLAASGPAGGGATAAPVPEPSSRPQP